MNPLPMSEEHLSFVRQIAQGWITQKDLARPDVGEQPDLIKETRLMAGKLAASLDCEIVEAAMEFARWAECLQTDMPTYPACCTSITA